MSVPNPSRDEIRAAGGELRIERSAGGGVHLAGYAIVFNSLSVDLGGFRERILPEAVMRTIREAIDVRALINHDPDPIKVLGSVESGELALRTDRHGLAVDISPPDTSAVKDLVKVMQGGSVRGMSFAFRTIEDDWHMEDGELIRDVIDMRIREVSVVTFPAYPDTEIAQRSLAEFRSTQSGKHSKAWWVKYHRTMLAR